MNTRGFGRIVNIGSVLISVKRRGLLAAFAAAIPGVADAQDRRKIVVGFPSWWPPSMEASYVERLREGLRLEGSP